MKTPILTVFCYGTLLAPEVIQTLIGRVPPSTPAVLLGSFRRHPVKNFVFPGLVRASKGDAQRVQGILYRDLSVNEMERLDFFEGDEYEKIECEVEKLNENNNERFATQVYLWTNPINELDLTQQWSYERFYGKNLQTYLERVVRPCREELDAIM